MIDISKIRVDWYDIVAVATAILVIGTAILLTRRPWRWRRFALFATAVALLTGGLLYWGAMTHPVTMGVPY